MPRPSVTRRTAHTAESSAGAQTIRARLFDVDVDRKKRIDDSIDYFGDGGGRRSAATSDSCGAAKAVRDGMTKCRR